MKKACYVERSAAGLLKIYVCQQLKYKSDLTGDETVVEAGQEYMRGVES